MEEGVDRKSRTADSDRGFGLRHAGEGPRIYDLFPPLIGTVERWIDHLPRISAMRFNWVHVGALQGADPVPGSATGRTAVGLDPRYKPPRTADEEGLLRRFVEAARQQGLRVMTDIGIADGAPRQGADAAGAASSARLARLLGLGIEGFICRAAVSVDGEIWAKVIEGARLEGRDICFVADTLGAGASQVAGLSGKGFDFLFNSVGWWDYRSEWLFEEQQRLSRVAPTISFPEMRNGERLGAVNGFGRNDLEARVKRNLLFSAVFSGGWMMPVGCEYGFGRRLDPARTTPADWEAPAFDLSEFVTALNSLRAKCPGLDLESAVHRISAPGGGFLAMLRVPGGHVIAAENGFVLLLNADRSRSVAIDGVKIYGETGGLFARFLDLTPLQAPKSLEPGRSLVLGPLELRIFEGRRDHLARAGAPSKPRVESAVPELRGHRVVIENLSPEIDAGRHPAKRTVGDELEVEADIFMDGHGHLEACVVYKAENDSGWNEAPMAEIGNDRWRGRVPLPHMGRWLYSVEAWLDAFESWRSDVAKKRAAGQRIELDLREGVELLRKAALRASGSDAERFTQILAEWDAAEGEEERERILFADELRGLMVRCAERHGRTRHASTLAVQVDRLAAGFSTWYELFPRSQSPDPTRSGTFADVVGRLAYVRDMGFDVLYFPPIHPIGRTNRKGRNNSLTARPEDPGSPYAIGSVEGGHTAIEPGLGSLEDFRRLVAAANAQGLEIALDFAIQCSPDHPWLSEHPDWFDWRVDGAMRYAENPPKKYEDIVNVNFEKGYPGLWYALRDVVLFWVEQGVKIFRVDNPHTKPIIFWEWMIADVRARRPEVIFLSEAFTRPKMMRKLAMAGFNQSYTYFTWRNTKHELTEYFTELSQGPSRDYLRPNLFTNTPDINPFMLQTGGRAAFMMRAALAATLASSYGIYSGFELCESAALPGREEYLDSEKYEIKRRNWDEPGNIRAFVGQLNLIRSGNPALHDFANLRFYNAFDERILLYGRMTANRDNALLIAVNLDPHAAHGCAFELPLWEFGLADHEALQVEDLFTGASWTWRGKIQHLSLDPAVNPAAIWRLSPVPS